MAVHGDGQAVHVDAQISLPVTAAHGTQPSSRQHGDRLMQHGAVLRSAQNRDQTRQRRLRGQMGLGAQRRRAAGTPTLAEEKQGRAKQLGQGIGDLGRRAGIEKSFDQPLDDPGALHDLPQHHRPRLGGQPIRSGLNAKGLVERRSEQGYGFTHGARWTSAVNPFSTLILQRNPPHASFHQLVQ